MYWGDLVIGFRCWFSDWLEEENYYFVVFIFKIVINRFKVFVLMENDKFLLVYSIDFNICKKMIF